MASVKSAMVLLNRLISELSSAALPCSFPPLTEVCSLEKDNAVGSSPMGECQEENPLKTAENWHPKFIIHEDRRTYLIISTRLSIESQLSIAARTIDVVVAGPHPFSQRALPRATLPLAKSLAPVAGEQG